MPSFSTPGAAAGAAIGAAAIPGARQNYMDTLRKALDANKAVNPGAKQRIPTTAVGAASSSATAAANFGSPVVQMNQMKNQQAQDASARTTQIVQEGANKRRAVVQANQQQRQDEIGFSDQDAQQNAQSYQVQDSSSARQQLVRSAMGLLGTGYAWGGGGYGVRSSRGTGKGTQNVIGVDCSGLTTYAYSTIGIRIPRTARQQGTIGYKTSIKNLRPGDLVVWNNGAHTSMYIGNGQIIESPNVGKRVRIRSLRPGEAVTGIHLSLSGD